MQLTSLYIHLSSFGSNEGKYIGKAEFKGQSGGVEVVLDPSLSGELLRLLADALVANTKKLAENLTAETIAQAEQPKQLTA